jgi:hypothetical protein
MLDTTKYAIFILFLLVLLLATYTVKCVGIPIQRMERTLVKHDETLIEHSAILKTLKVSLSPATIIQIKERFDVEQSASSNRTAKIP